MTVMTGILWVCLIVLTAITLYSFYRFALSAFAFTFETGLGLSTIYIVVAFVFVHFPAIWTISVGGFYLTSRYRTPLYDVTILVVTILIAFMTTTTPVVRTIY